MNYWKILISLILWIFPWSIRRPLLNVLFGYKISKTAHIGYSIIIPDNLEMSNHAHIGHLTFCKGISLLKLGEFSSIGNLNWITGSPIKNANFFKHRTDRDPSLVLGDQTAITNRHLIDCTDRIDIGEYTTVAGFRSQLLTHSIDIMTSRQNCSPISIGSYCFLGTACVLLPGTSLGNYCVLGANSLLNKHFTSNYGLYGGVPATLKKELPQDAEYFRRKTGFVH